VIVCQCFAVSDRTIGAHVAAGATSLGELAEQCGAGADCGGCVRRLQRLLVTAERLLDSAAA
jgi:bacterioferritin-associated ferredoxin